MRINSKIFTVVWVIIALLIASPIPQAQTPKAKYGGRSSAVPFSLLPGSPLDLALSVWELSPSLQYHTVTSRTREELLNRTSPVGPEYLQEAQIRGEEGVVEEGTYVLPFGTKDEKVGIAFLTGDYVPPAGERLQPALAQLARQRAAQLSVQGAGVQPTVYALILLNGRMDEALRAWLEERGVELLGFYPYTAYQARIPVAQLHVVAQHPQVLWVGQPYPLQKLSPELWTFMGDTTGERTWIYVSLFGHDEHAREVVTSMTDQTGTYDPKIAVIPMVADASTINRLLDMDAVLFIEPIPVCEAQTITSQPAINADLLWYHGLDGRPRNGRSVKVGVMDSGFYIYHRDFSNIIWGTSGYNHTSEGELWDDPKSHGTRVLGILLGAGIARPEYRGTASGIHNTRAEGSDLLLSKVLRMTRGGQLENEGNSVMEGLLDMEGRTEPEKRHVFNASISAPYSSSTGTDPLSRKIDQMFRDGILAVVAAGNKGPGRSTISPPGVAKGALTVGSIDHYEDAVSKFSSRGPTSDGRSKPDVVAPGEFITSTCSGGEICYSRDDGTSFAAPHVTGIAASLIVSTGAPAWAIKSMIIANAIDLGHAPLAGGKGKVDGMLCHYSIDGLNTTWWGRNSSTGTLRTIDFTLPQRASLLRIALVYPDEPAAAGASTALQNDLDLYLDREPFSTGPSGDWASLSRKNTVEFIAVQNAPAGQYRIKVYSYSHNWFSRQDWAVTVRAVYGPIPPTLTLSLTTPAAVRPNTLFEVTGSVKANSYVASGVSATISAMKGTTQLPRGRSYLVRYAPNGQEERFEYGSSRLGNIPAGFTRKLVREFQSPRTEGEIDLEFQAASTNGSKTSVQGFIIVDGTPPEGWRNMQPVWANSPNPECSMEVRDTRAGLAIDRLYYWYRTPEAGVFGPFACSTYARDGSREFERIIAPRVPFGREDGSGQFQIRFRAYDRAGNYSDSGWMPVRIDLTPPQHWQNFEVTGGGPTGLTPTCRIQVRDVLSGLAPSARAAYRYSTDAGRTWSEWQRASITGRDGSTQFETITAENVPFNELSTVRNWIQFAVRDVAGNWGYSPSYTVPTRYGTTLSVNDASGTIGDTVTLTASLSRTFNGAPVPNKRIEFRIDGVLVGTAVTDYEGRAEVTWTVTTGELGDRRLTASFAGDNDYQEANATAVFTRMANTIVTVDSVVARPGETVILEASLRQAHDSKLLNGYALHFYIDGNPVGYAMTGAYGEARLEYTVPPDASLGAHRIEVKFRGKNPLNPSTGTATLHLVRTKLRGRVYLGDFRGNPELIQITFELRDPGSTTARETHIVTLDSASEYTIGTALDGVFDVAAKGSHWLRETQTQVRVDGEVSVDFGLINGDVDGDNQVTLLDFARLVAAFGSVAGDENWNPNADLDGDQEVTLLDFGILVRNFGAIGDQ